ncbi:transcriptional regulator [Acinetobacter defluvii]|uniref:Helix-turn-helix transcriptional regulator n=1 Tax=Acinetobacter defluvii TaxID=1871111 RepID=A0A2S2FD64_9GAMM|nr:helix-turn-helix transcriptional regulator [Acinetobacter defluvii]AWL28848.1 helix-turn-helix transcriptional regulator [Acinetobacter defluvii]NNP71389.1 transcriptional regulator [Acinetobacter defluvii]
MDKRFKSLSPIEQMQRRQAVLDTIEQHPEWEIYQVAKFLRTELRLTLPEMAKITKIAPQTLQKIEQAESNPTLQSILKLLNAFGLDLMVKRN